MDHELRRTLAGKSHTRPTVPVATPALVLHQAFFNDDGGTASRRFAQAFAAQVGQDPPSPGATHLIAHTEEGIYKWERHGEFSTWTFVRPGSHSPDASIELPALLRDAPGERFVAAAIVITDRAPTEEDLDRTFGKETYENERTGSMISNGAAGIWTGFRIGEDGWTRFIFANLEMNTFRAGRVVRRLLEIEVYRIAALFAFPVAIEAKREIDVIEGQVGEVIADKTRPEAQVLDALIDAARDIERIAQATAFRFGAANAYRRLVNQRVTEFREERVGSLQRLSFFLERRFAPAMDTCASTQGRLETLAKRVERAAGLLRTRVDLAMAAQNQLQLESMNQNARAQLRLQKAVEGFSVAAISYYAFSLLAKVLAPGLHSLGEVGEPVATSALVVVTVAAVWIVLSRLRHKL